ncbi:MAG: nucleotidyltransferase domain-containing protein [Pseudomonadota bacterium]
MTIPNIEYVRARKPEILQMAEKHGIANIRVFGSVARGDANENSDIDFLVEFTKPTFDNYFYFKEGLEKLFDREVDIVELENVRNPIRRESMISSIVPL